MEINKKNIVLLCLTLFLFGCSTVKTTKFDKRGKGVPYHLPKAIIKVSAEYKGVTSKNWEINVKPVLVPDRDQLYYLNSSTNVSFSSAHTFKVKNGLLTTVSTVDEGTVGETLLAVVDTGSSVLKYKAIGGSSQSQTDAFYKDGMFPSKDEITAILGMVQGDEFSFTYSENNGSYSLPGTTSLLMLVSNVVHEPLANSSSRAGSVSSTSFNGIYTRTLTNASVNTQLVINTKELKEKREKAINGKISASKKKIANKENDIESKRKEIETACSGLSEEQRRNISQLINSLDSSNSETRKSYENCKATYVPDPVKYVEEKIKVEEKNIVTSEAMLTKLDSMETDSNYVLLDNHAVSLIPDPDRILRIPLSRAPLGKSTNTLTLENGILLDYFSDKPAPVVEVAKAVRDVFKGIVAIPAEIIQLKIDTTSSKKELLEAEKNLVEAQTSLDKAIDDQSGIGKQISDIDKKIDLYEKQQEQAAQAVKNDRAIQIATLEHEKESLRLRKEVVDNQKDYVESQKALALSQNKDEEAENFQRQLDALKNQEELIKQQTQVVNAMLDAVNANKKLEEAKRPPEDTEPGPGEEQLNLPEV